MSYLAILWNLLRAVGPWRTARRLWFMVRLILTSEPASEEVVILRQNACSGCYIWDKRRDICGHLGETWIDPETHQQETLGCWCKLKTKRRLVDAQCWLDVHDPAPKNRWPS